MTTQIGVYATSTFSVPNPTAAQMAEMMSTAQALGTSGFNLILLASMHVHEDGSIYLNDTYMFGSQTNQLSPDMAQYVETMKGSSGTVLVSVGGGGMVHGNAVGWWDFTRIKTLIAQYPDPADNPFFQNLTTMFAAYPGITGIDIDLEAYGPNAYEPFLDTVITLVQWLNTNGLTATICPYDSPDFWKQVIQGSTTISWVNLQNATGTIGTFQSTLEASGFGADQVLGGYQLSSQDTPATVQSTFQTIGSDWSGLGGGWLWNLGGVPIAQVTDYANAVSQGLSS